MKKSDTTFLNWLENVDFEHEHFDNRHKFIAMFRGKELFIDINRNPVLAFITLGTRLRQFYFKEYRDSSLDKKKKIKKEIEKEKVGPIEYFDLNTDHIIINKHEKE